MKLDFGPLRGLPTSIFCVVTVLAVTTPLVAQDRICVSEIMYHPVEQPAFNADGSPVLDLTHDVHEFIEFHNFGTNTVALEGWEISGAVKFAFPPGAQIATDQYLVVAKDPVRLAAVPAYGLACMGCRLVKHHAENNAPTSRNDRRYVICQAEIFVIAGELNQKPLPATHGM